MLPFPISSGSNRADLLAAYRAGGIVCPGCGWVIYPGGYYLRSDARHCSPTCRKRDWRRRRRATRQP